MGTYVLQTLQHRRGAVLWLCLAVAVLFGGLTSPLVAATHVVCPALLAGQPERCFNGPIAPGGGIFVPPPPVVDRDQDGIPDAQDTCPFIADPARPAPVLTALVECRTRNCEHEGGPVPKGPCKRTCDQTCVEQARSQCSAGCGGNTSPCYSKCYADASSDCCDESCR